MEKMFNVTFNEFNIEKQREVVATTNDEDILWQGATSKDLETRIKTLKNPKTTSEMLEKMLEEAIGENNNDLIIAVLNNSNFIPEVETVRKLEKMKYDDKKMISKHLTNHKIINMIIENGTVEGGLQVSVINNGQFTLEEKKLIVKEASENLMDALTLANHDVEMLTELVLRALEEQNINYIHNMIVENEAFVFDRKYLKKHIEK